MEPDEAHQLHIGEHVTVEIEGQRCRSGDGDHTMQILSMVGNGEHVVLGPCIVCGAITLGERGDDEWAKPTS